MSKYVKHASSPKQQDPHMYLQSDTAAVTSLLFIIMNYVDMQTDW